MGVLSRNSEGKMALTPINRKSGGSVFRVKKTERIKVKLFEVKVRVRLWSKIRAGPMPNGN